MKKLFKLERIEIWNERLFDEQLIQDFGNKEDASQLQLQLLTIDLSQTTKVTEPKKNPIFACCRQMIYHFSRNEIRLHIKNIIYMTHLYMKQATQIIIVKILKMEKNV